MELNNIKPAVGSVQKKTRIGRGPGSGYGGTSTRGHKGAKSRSGYKRKIGFEGGQMPLYRRLPKRGFKNRNTLGIEAVNIEAFEKFENDTVVTIDLMLENGIIKDVKDGVKVLGNGTFTKKLTIQANAFSEGAKAKIEELGGKAEVI